jgi:glycerol kinase
MPALADQLQSAVARPAVLETTAWGAARLAGMHAGVYPPLGAQGFRRVERTFKPQQKPAESNAQHDGWMKAIARVRS